MYLIVRLKYLFLCGILVFVCLDLFGQKNIAEVTKVRKDAAQFFKDGNYIAAFPLYSQLLSLNPKDPDLNFRFGVCYLYTDKRDVEKPLKYLEFASKSNGIDYHVYFYLGKAYHYNYRFVEAVRMFQVFKQYATNREMTDLLVDRQIAMCQNGMQLLSRISDIYVLEKTEVKRVDFYRSYYKADINGVFLAEPENFKTKADKKSDDKNVVFFPDKQQVLCFSSYGKEATTGRDIYFASRKTDGTWDVPVRLDNTINTPFDEDFPYLLDDGKTLYFSSTGHNSMGGFDIFRSVYDSVKKQWSTPENLDFAINTPFDDVLFVPDATGKYAYFASDRSAQPEKILVYKVRIDLRPEQKIELDLQNGLTVDDTPEQKYLQAISLIKNLASLEVNATTSMFTDDSITAEKKPAIVAQQTKPVTADTDPGYSSRAKKLITQRSENEKFVDSAFALVTKAENSLDDLKMIYLTTEELTLSSIKTNEKSIVDLVHNDIESIITKKQKKLEQLKNMAGQVQKSVNIYELSKSKKLLSTMYSIIDATDTASMVTESLSDELRAAVLNDNNAESRTGSARFFSGQAISRLKQIAAGYDFSVIAKQDNNSGEKENQENEEEPKVNKPLLDTEQEDTGNVTANKLAEGDSIPSTYAEIMAEREPAKEIHPQEEKPYKKENLENGKQVLSALTDSLKTAEKESKYQVLLAEAVIRSLKSTFNKLTQTESKGENGYAIVTHVDVQLSDKLNVPADSVSLIINQIITAQLIKEYLTDYQASSESMYKTLSDNLSDKRVIQPSIDSGAYQTALKDKIAQFRSETKNQLKTDAVAAYIGNTRKRIIEQKNSYLKAAATLSSEADLLESSSEKLLKDATSLTSSKAEKEYKNKAAEFLKISKEKREEAINNYNKFVLFNNSISFITEDVPQLKLLFDQFKAMPERMVTKVKPAKSDMEGTISLQKDVDEYLSSSLNSKDHSFPATIERDNQAQKSTDEIKKITDRYVQQEKLRIDTTSLKKIRAQIETFKEKNAFHPEGQQFALFTEPESTPANEVAIPVSQAVESEREGNQDAIMKLNRIYSKFEKDYITETSRGKKNKKVEALDPLMDTISKFEQHLTEQLNSEEMQSNENKSAAMQLELQLFEVKAVGNKTKYSKSLNKAQLISKSRSDEITSFITSLIQDATHDMAYASSLYEQLARAESENSKKDVLQQVLKYQERALSRLDLAMKASDKDLNLSPEQIKSLAASLNEDRSNAIDSNRPANKFIAAQPVEEPEDKTKAKEEIEDQAINKITDSENQEVEKEKPEQVKNEPFKIDNVPVVPEEENNNPIANQKVNEPEKSEENKLNDTNTLPANPLEESAKEVEPTEQKIVTKKKEVVPRKQEIVTIPDRIENPEEVQPKESRIAAPIKGSEALATRTERNIAEAVSNSSKPKIESLYYTVQVGVYRTPRMSYQLMNIVPLFEEKLNNGLYKYCSGIFMDYRNAVGHRDGIIAKGIPDAFVVAYYKGKKISNDDAYRMQGGKLSEIMDQNTIEDIVKANTRPQEAHYCVQLVAYKKAIPDAAFRSFEEKLNQKVATYTTETGMNVLLTLPIKDFQSAMNKRAEVIASGVTDAFIVGFINGKRVPSADVRKVLGQ